MRRRRFITALAVILLMAGLTWMVAPIALPAIGNMLVVNEQSAGAEAAIVLAGDYSGRRILKACELLRTGVVPRVLVSGPVDLPLYGVNEADAAIRFVVEAGCDASRLEAVPVQALSTTEEARAFRAEIRKRGIRRVVLVTGNSHSARARRTFRDVFDGDAEIRMVAAPDKFFTPADWWRSREGQKVVFFEVSKTIASFLGL